MYSSIISPSNIPSIPSCRDFPEFCEAFYNCTAEGQQVKYSPSHDGRKEPSECLGFHMLLAENTLPAPDHFIHSPTLFSYLHTFIQYVSNNQLEKEIEKYLFPRNQNMLFMSY